MSVRDLVALDAARKARLKAFAEWVASLPVCGVKYCRCMDDDMYISEIVACAKKALRED